MKLAGLRLYETKVTDDGRLDAGLDADWKWGITVAGVVCLSGATLWW